MASTAAWVNTWGVAFSVAEFQRMQIILAPWDWTSLFAHGLPTDQVAERWLLGVFFVLPLVCACFAVARAPAPGLDRRGDAAFVVPLALLGVMVTWGFVRSNLETRLPDAIVPPVLLGGWLVARSNGAGARTAVIALVAFTFLCVLPVGDVGEHINRSGLFFHGGVQSRMAWLHDRRHRPDLLVKGQMTRGLVPVLSYIERCTRPTDRLVVTGNAPEEFVVAHRRFASRSPFFEPGYYASPGEQQGVVDAIEEAEVPLVLVELRTLGAFELAFSHVAAGLKRSYTAFTDGLFEQATGIRLLTRRAAIGTARDASTGWPCPGGGPHALSGQP